MRQILLLVAAMALGLLAGRLTGGFPFSSAVCVAAGVFLVTPTLFRFERADLGFALHELRPIGLNLALNFVALVAAALAIGWASRDVGIAAALLLLAMLPGGGMVMHWIRTSGADIRLGFLIAIVNLALILPVTFAFGAFETFAAPHFPPPELGPVPGPRITIPPLGPFMVLIVVPFILSRWARAEAPRLVAFAERNARTVSQVTIVAIVFYLFGLETAQLLFRVPASVLAVGAAATVAFYAVAILLAELAAPRGPEGRAVYWHLVTRYITLALILATFWVDSFGPSFLVPLMVAYLVQFAAAGRLSARMLARAAA